MRLKGGKLLLDLTKYNISEDISYQCSDEELKAILDKGLSVKIFSEINCVIDLIPQSISKDGITYSTLTLYYGGADHRFGVTLDINERTLSFFEN